MPALNADRTCPWYFPGIAAAITSCVTQPIDTLKVLLITQTVVPPLKLYELIIQVYQTEGWLGFYSGLSAAMLRQLTYTLARSGSYEYLKVFVERNNTLMLFLISFASGVAGSMAGMPAAVVNVRMQNNMGLPVEERRDYGNVFHGIYVIIRDEGILALYSGIFPFILRGTLMTLSSNVVYDQVKYLVMDWGFEDDTFTHLLCAIIASWSGTTVSQPIDVIKTQMMNQSCAFFDVIIETAADGPLAFYAGYIPAMAREVPGNIINFLLLEQMRLHFGTLEKDQMHKNK